MKVLLKEGIKIEENSIENPGGLEIDEQPEMTNIWIPVKLRDEGLKPLKIIQRESWYSVVQRLVDEHNALLKVKPKK